MTYFVDGPRIGHDDASTAPAACTQEAAASVCHHADPHKSYRFRDDHTFDVCGPQPRPDANRRYGGWNHEAMDD